MSHVSPMSNKNTNQPTLKQLIRISETKFRIENDELRLSFFTFDELEEIETVVNLLRKGVKRHKDSDPFVVFIDDEMTVFKTFPSFRKFISSCRVDRLHFQIFRNIDKGITIDFDKSK